VREVRSPPGSITNRRIALSEGRSRNALLVAGTIRRRTARSLVYGGNLPHGFPFPAVLGARLLKDALNGPAHVPICDTKLAQAPVLGVPFGNGVIPPNLDDSHHIAAARTALPNICSQLNNCAPR
jgi:hypothetical protein